MFVEISFPGIDTTECPFCGAEFNITTQESRLCKSTNINGSELLRRSVSCICKNEHLFMVITETHINNDEFEIYNRIHVYYQDINDYINCEINTSKEKSYNLNEEDISWQIQRVKQLNLIQKAKLKRQSKKCLNSKKDCQS